MDRWVQEVAEAGVAESRVWSRYARLRLGHHQARIFCEGECEGVRQDGYVGGVLKKIRIEDAKERFKLSPAHLLQPDWVLVAPAFLRLHRLAKRT